MLDKFIVVSLKYAKIFICEITPHFQLVIFLL